MGRHAGHSRMRRDRLCNHAARGHLRTLADFDVAENLRTGADHDPASDLGMPIADFLAGTPERHRLQHRHVVLDHAGLAYDNAGRMIDENAAAYTRGRMDVDCENFGDATLQESRYAG